MKQFGFLLLAAFASTSAMASEVGATFPQLANTPALTAIAIAETGASNSLASSPDSDVVLATQHSPLDSYIENAYQALEVELEQKLFQELSRYSIALANR